ncbi:MAG: hypothetical protein AAGJ18_30735, partial [Bacteroidota bacterium]
FLFSILLLAVLSSLTAQETTLPAELPQPITLQNILPVQGKGYVKVKSDNFEAPTSVILEYYNYDNQLLAEKRIPTERQQEYFAVENIFVWKNSVVFLASLYTPVRKNNRLLLYQYDLPTLVEKQTKVLLTTKAPPDVRIRFLNKLSPDKSKLAVATWSFTDMKKEGQIGLHLFDADFQETASKTVELPYKNERLFQESLLVNDEGNIYYIGNHYKGNLNAEFYGSQMEKFVLAYFSTTQKRLVLPLKLDKLRFDQTKFLLNTQQQLVGFSLVKKGLSDKFQGLVISALNPTSQQFDLKEISITKDDFKEAFTAYNPEIKVSKIGFTDFFINQAIALEDGYLLLGERVRESTFITVEDTEITTPMLYEDILTLKINTEGQVQWMNRIPKRQVMLAGSPYASFKAIRRYESLLFFYNDNYANLTESVGRRTENATLEKAELVFNIMDLKTGQFQPRKLQNLMGKDYRTLPKYIHVVSPNELFFYGQKRGEKEEVAKTLKLLPKEEKK